MAIEALLLLLQAAPSVVIEPPPALRTPDGRAIAPEPPPNAGATAAPLDSASIPAGSPGPSVSAVQGRDAGYAQGAAAPAALRPVFVRRPALVCSDFRPASGAGWTAGAAVEFPGPQGPVQLTQGEIVTPGEYVGGMDLGSVLQRDCPRTFRPPTG